MDFANMNTVPQFIRKIIRRCRYCSSKINSGTDSSRLILWFCFGGKVSPNHVFVEASQTAPKMSKHLSKGCQKGDRKGKLFFLAWASGRRLFAYVSVDLTRPRHKAWWVFPKLILVLYPIPFAEFPLVVAAHFKPSVWSKLLAPTYRWIIAISQSRALGTPWTNMDAPLQEFVILWWRVHDSLGPKLSPEVASSHQWGVGVKIWQIALRVSPPNARAQWPNSL